MLISICGSSMRLRTSTDSQPATSPIATPPADTPMNLTMPSPGEKWPETTAATASL